MYDTSEESCAQGLHFFFLHLRASSNLWGRYDPKTEKSRRFSLSHIESCVIPLLKALIKGFVSFLHLRLLSNLWGRCDSKTEKKQNVFPCNRVISSSRIICNASIESSHHGLHFFLYNHEL